MVEVKCVGLTVKTGGLASIRQGLFKLNVLDLVWEGP